LLTTRLAAVAVLFALAAALPAARAPQGTALQVSDDDVRRILVERIDALTAGAGGIGIVVGRIDSHGRRVISEGHLAGDKRRQVDGNTAFEIGSITKVFTALLLADMAQRGEMRLSDAASAHLPRGVTVPQRNGRAITLLDLATHTSGLPFMPADARLRRFLSTYTLPREPGAEWDYSNLAYWVLGEALASRARVDLATLMRIRIFDPLEMPNTRMAAGPGSVNGHLAIGHDAALQRAQAFADAPVYREMPAAGGLLSTANDLLKFLSGSMGLVASPLSPAMAVALSTTRPTGHPGELQALGWLVVGKGADTVVVHDGGTWGYASSMGWHPATGEGVVVLSNHVASVEDIARHLLRPEVPLTPPTRMRREIPMDPAVLDGYRGRFEAPGEGVFIIEREGRFLMVQPPADWGLPKMRLRAESPSDFFVAELPLLVRFETDSSGRASQIVVHPPRGQKPVTAKRQGPHAG